MMNSLKNTYFLYPCTLVVALLVSGCVNLKPTPDLVKTYTLGPAPLEATADGSVGRGIYVARPDLPRYLSGTHFYYRKLDGELKRIASARWAEPMEEGVARAMSQFLAVSGDPVSRGYFPWPNRSTEVAELKMSFFRIGAYGDGTIRVQTDWSLIESGETVASGSFKGDALTWETGDPASAVAGLNAGLRALAAEIASDIGSK
jgi:uncharacterized lipoprotein YmbA